MDEDPMPATMFKSPTPSEDGLGDLEGGTEDSDHELSDEFEQAFGLPHLEFLPGGRLRLRPLSLVKTNTPVAPTVHTPTSPAITPPPVRSPSFELTPPPKVSRGRGRPRGSTNKPKSSPRAKTKQSQSRKSGKDDKKDIRHKRKADDEEENVQVVSEKAGKRKRQKTQPETDSDTESESEDREFIGEATIEIQRPPQNIGTAKKPKIGTSPPVLLGPLSIYKYTTYEQLLSTLATLCKVSDTWIDTSTLLWKFSKPANSSVYPLTSNTGFASMKRSLKEQRLSSSRIPLITIKLASPKQPERDSFPWLTPGNANDMNFNPLASSSVPQQHPLTNASGTTDDKLDELVMQLKQRYSIGKCTIHCNILCYHYIETNLHFELTRQRLLAWAVKILKFEATIEKAPIGTAPFHERDAIKRITTSSNLGQSTDTFLNLQVPPAQFNPYGFGYMHHPYMPPPPSSTSFQGGSSVSHSIPPLESGLALTSLDNIPFSCSLEEYCLACGHDDETRHKLDVLGFKPGDQISHLKWADGPDTAGFRVLDWSRVLRADMSYRQKLVK